MEMRILCELSRRLLEETDLKQKWGNSTWQEAFEACGSHQEWLDFVARKKSDPILDELRTRYEAIAHEVLAIRSARVKPRVVLPNF